VWVAAILLALVSAVLAWSAFRASDAPTRRRVLTLTLPWIILPTVALLLWSWTVRPLYAERYTAFSVPGLALLLAYGFDRWPGDRPWRRSVAAAFVVASLVVQVSQRAEDSKGAENYRGLAGLVAERRPASVLYGAAGARSVAAAYPRAFSGVPAPNVTADGAPSGTLWGTVAPTRSLARDEVVPHGGGFVVLVERTRTPWPRTDYQRWLVRRGCGLVERERGGRFTAFLVRCP
jgi:mannosyltransferase